MQQAKLVIVGGGIVGLATAYRFLERYPGLRPIVLEKEQDVGEHQTGHNSGVLHSGIYYRPGSLRAQNCRTGKLAMEEFCAAHNIPYDICGKVIVAVDESELPQLEKIYERGQQNGVRCEIISRERLHELEPHAAGIKAIHVPEAGIVDFRRVAQKLADIVRQQGGEVVRQARVIGFRPNSSGAVVESTAGEFAGEYIVTCAGLYADRVAKMTGETLESQIVPFRGEYYDLKPDIYHLCRNLIYPVPDTRFPFLGVHFTRMIQGGVECGPNAVLAFSREGYRKTDFRFGDLWEALSYRGFRRMARKHWRMGFGEMWRSFSKRAFVKALQRLIPDIRSEHLVPGRAGVRAQALGMDGNLIDDFVIKEADRIINVCNAPSPAATSSLNIGRLVVEKLATMLD